MELAKIYVSESCAQVISKKPIPAGLVGGYIDVVYAEDLWADLSKTVVFRSNITRDVVTDGRRVPVPADVLAAGVRLWVGFFGVAGDKALPTFWASLGTVGEAADPSGDESTDPTLPVWAQILEKTADLEKKVERDYQPKGDYLESSQLQPAIDTALAQAKESGAFDGPPGINGLDGLDGQDGAPGKSAYEYAKDGGYTGTEEEFAAKLAAENPGGADWNASKGEPGHVKHRTHWVDFEPVALAENITMSSGSQYSNVYYNAVKDSDVVTVIYDGVTYVCPVTLVKDITEFGDESYFYIGNFRNAAPDYPFSFWGYIANQFSLFNAESGDHVLSVYVQQEKAVHKLDKKFIPDDIGSAPSDWNAAEGEPGHVLNRTHWVEGGIVEIVPETTLTTTEDSPGQFVVPDGVLVIEAGKTYIVTYNGTEYTCVAVDGGELETEMAGLGIGVIGNYAMALGTGNTGEPFVAFYSPGDGTQIMDLNGALSITASVSVDGEVVHKLDEKFLPVHLFGTHEVEEPITFNGDITGKTVLDLSNGTVFVKMSDHVLTEEECVGSSGTTYAYGMTGRFTVISTKDCTDNFGVPCFVTEIDGSTMNHVAVLKEAVTFNDIEVLPGTYFLAYFEGENPLHYVTQFDALPGIIYDVPNKMPDEYISDSVVRKTDIVNPDMAENDPESDSYVQNRTHWTDDNGTVHQLAREYIPAEWLAALKEGTAPFVNELTITSQSKEQTITDSCDISWHINTSRTNGTKVIVVYDGVTYECVFDNSGHAGNVSLRFSDRDDTGEPFLIRIWSNRKVTLNTSDSDGTEHTVSATVVTMVPDPMPEKYMPESLESVILRSSTADSTKLFKLTVDDAGTISATEVT